MSERDYRMLKPSERSDYGAIVTFGLPDGRYFPLHRRGTVTAAVRAACEDALAIHPAARVKSISTPDTIYNDLRGRKILVDSGSRAMPYEATLLAKIGLLRMLDPAITLHREQRTTWRRDRGES